MKTSEYSILDSIAKRAHLIVNQMIFHANTKRGAKSADPKVGGHPSASASALHIMGALHLKVKSGYDHIVNKPHASPVDHAYNYLLNLLFDPKSFQCLSTDQAKSALTHFRSFPKRGYAFQSYHSYKDPDCHNVLPSGTVGIPPVVLGYLALAFKMLRQTKQVKIPQAHFWALIGDSEFREGSIMEAIPDLAEREVGNLTWIVDYNRQSLDGVRLVNEKQLKGTDAKRIELTLKANGWDVISLQHGSFRKELFEKSYGGSFKYFLEQSISDPEFHALLFKTRKELKKELLEKYSFLKSFLKHISEQDLESAIRDVGGHDFKSIVSALENSKKNPDKPCLIIAHTIKGWGLEMAGKAGNHSSLVSQKELDQLEGGGVEDFPLFSHNDPEGKFLKKRREQLYSDMLEQRKIKEHNRARYSRSMVKSLKHLKTFSVDFKKMNSPHTQWMLGQITAKLSRIATTEKQALRSSEEKALQGSSRLLCFMSPDVGTSTNLGAAMNEKVYGPEILKNQSVISSIEDRKSPVLVSREEEARRFFRFEIAEANAISCMAGFGKIRDILGIPILPLGTIYDFFIKRALDQFFYALYIESGFILVGTPSGVTLSPEGAQHGWKSDFQIPGQIIWEPFFLQELDWIMAHVWTEHFLGQNKGRAGVLLRCVTRGMDQKEFLKLLRKQKRFKSIEQNRTLLKVSDDQSVAVKRTGVFVKAEDQAPPIQDAAILECIREEVLSGAYWLINYRGYVDYVEGENVVHLFSMGSPTTSAIAASYALLKKGIYANVIVVTSPCLLVGHLGHVDDYKHLRSGLGLTNTLSPVVSVHDGEPGILDNLGSLLGVYQESLSVRIHSLCGTPDDVYQYHSMDPDSLVQNALKVLNKTPVPV